MKNNFYKFTNYMSLLGNNKNIRHSLVFIPLLWAVVGCSMLSPAPINIEYQNPDPDRVRFKGKGAGAGMMLSSSMGAMGIAVGVAIDEGIGKDINETALSHNVNFNHLFKTSLQQYIQSTPELNHVRKVKINMERYGFKTASGENDPVKVEIKATILIDDKQYTIEYPNSITDKATVPTQPLETIKIDASAIERIFKQSIYLALSTTFKY